MPTTMSESVGAELRRWREHRRLSQLALASRADVSTRHLSYVETGRSRPTSSMILRLALALDVPLREQNHLLLSGGFAPAHPERALDHADLEPVMRGLRNLLDAHAPSPALLLDDHWDVVDANTAVDALTAGCAPDLLEPPINVLRLSLHPRGLAPRIRNLATWRAHLVQQLERRIQRTAGDPALRALHAELMTYPDDGALPADRPVAPVILLELESQGATLRLFSMAGAVEAPSDVTLDGLHVETFLPADDETRAHLSAGATSAAPTTD